MPGTSDALPPLREIIAEHELSAKKSLGQNFLLDFNLTRKIARASGPLAGAVVYEVGPGPGGLTRALLAEGAARIIAVERDRRCIAALEAIARAYAGRVEVVSHDAMKVDEPKLLAQFNAAPPVRVAANLPYNIATALLVKWLTVADWPPFWSSLTLMFQREVAERLVAAPGSSQYGRLSVIGQWRTRSRIVFDVDRHAFTPAPNVTSSLVRLDPLTSPCGEARVADLERVTAALFGQRRKMVRTSLKQLSPDVNALLAPTGIDPQARPQDIAVPQFAALARSYRERFEEAKD